jgi:hypothetical protein
MEVHADSKAALIDIEELTQPRTEEAGHARISVRELHAAVRLRTFARVQRDTGSEERVGAERSDSRDAFGVTRFDLGELGDALRVGAAVGPWRRLEGVKGTSRTQRETEDLLTPSSAAMSASVRFSARNARARSCSSTLPR